MKTTPREILGRVTPFREVLSIGNTNQNVGKITKTKIVLVVYLSG